VTTTQVHPEDCDDQSITAHPHSVVQHHHNTEHSKLLPWLMLCAMLSGFAVAASVFCIIVMGWLMHEYHVMTITVENHDSLMMRYGIKQPGDVMRGPNGNLDYTLPQERK
jgi:hypothetical protein